MLDSLLSSGFFFNLESSVRTRLCLLHEGAMRGEQKTTVPPTIIKNIPIRLKRISITSPKREFPLFLKSLFAISAFIISNSALNSPDSCLASCSNNLKIHDFTMIMIIITSYPIILNGIIMVL